MIKASMAFILALLLLISAGPVIGADFAEGNGEYRSGKNGTYTILVTGRNEVK